jgi:hypothetical protein
MYKLFNSDGGAPKVVKNNGTCGTDSCNKLTVIFEYEFAQWRRPFDCVEVRFKTAEKNFTAIPRT